MFQKKINKRLFVKIKKEQKTSIEKKSIITKNTFLQEMIVFTSNNFAQKCMLNLFELPYCRSGYSSFQKVYMQF